MYKWQNLNNTGHEIYSYFIMEIIQIKIEFVNIFLLNMRILTECFYNAFQNNFNSPNDHDRYGIGTILRNVHCSWARKDFTQLPLFMG
jgi:hypothetical protein